MSDYFFFPFKDDSLKIILVVVVVNSRQAVHKKKLIDPYVYCTHIFNKNNFLFSSDGRGWGGGDQEKKITNINAGFQELFLKLGRKKKRYEI